MKPFNALAAAAFIGASLVPIAPVKPKTCINLYDGGDRVCLHNVYSNGGSHKTLVISINSRNPVSLDINCMQPDWEANSIFDRACSDYSLTGY